MNLLISRLQGALAHREVEIGSVAYGSDCNNGDDGNTNDGGDEPFGDPALSRPSRVKLPCKYGCQSFNRKQELARHYLRRKLHRVHTINYYI
jgi:hypothetical protein